MKVILAGQRSFGADALAELWKGGHDVAYVVSRPDDKVWNWAERHGIPTRPSVDAREVAAVNADLIVCAHSHDFIGRKSRGATRLGALIGHPSLLPRHRGKSAVEWTTRFRDPIAGFTWFWADNGVDTGPVSHQAWIHVDPAWDHHQLWNELYPLGLSLLGQAMEELHQGILRWYPQDERFATREPAIEPARLYRPELPAIGSGPAGFSFAAPSVQATNRLEG